MAAPLVFVGGKQRLPEPAEHAGRVVEAEQHRADRVFPHGTHAVREHEPAGRGFERRTAVADLHILPGIGRLQDDRLGAWVAFTP